MFDSLNSQVFAVVVTYYPRAEVLDELLSALILQVKGIVIIDNTPVTDGVLFELNEIFSMDEIELIRLGENYGIAKALNLGIERAVDSGATHVLLSDQDSLPEADMVKQLLVVEGQLAIQGKQVACIGAAFRDHNTGALHKFQVPSQRRLFFTTCEGDCAVPWVEVISTITSGSLIPARVFVDVGLMREDYFIDFVDVEWCFRARHRGYKIYGTSLARMEHRVGGETFRAWLGGWKTFNGYPPDRLYYQYRNGMFLLRDGFISRSWKFRLSLTWLSNVYAYTLFAPHRMKNLKAILCGIWDGARSTGGRLVRRTF